MAYFFSKGIAICLYSFVALFWGRIKGVSLEKKKVKLKQQYFRLLVFYILLITIFFVLYVSLIIRSEYLIGRDQYEVDKLKLQESASSYIDSILKSAEIITSRVNYSLSFRDPYIKLLSGEELSTKDRATIIP